VYVVNHVYLFHSEVQGIVMRFNPKCILVSVIRLARRNTWRGLALISPRDPWRKAGTWV